MDGIFKIGVLSQEWQWGLFAINIIPIFFKNNVKKKTKNTLNKKHLNSWPLYSVKATHKWLLRIRSSREANI